MATVVSVLGKALEIMVLRSPCCAINSRLSGFVQRFPTKRNHFLVVIQRLLDYSKIDQKPDIVLIFSHYLKQVMQIDES